MIMYKLQKILTNGFIEIDGTKHMYYRSSVTIYSGLNGEGILYKDNWFEFFTYFNSLSVEKWRKYTYAGNFYLVLEAKGKFTIELFGHYGEKESHIRKEWLGSYDYDLSEKTQIILPYPIGMQSKVVAFQIHTNKKSYIYDAYYAADINNDKFSTPYIALVTTTFKRETDVNRNIELLKEQIFSDIEYAHAFCYNIVDNGRTLTEQTSYEQSIRIFHNKNVGGAGGFARGMIESLRQPIKPTHILLMDDDVNVSPESFKRIYKLLSILRPEYDDYFISGAMLNMDAANIQHENTGVLVEEGYCKPLNSGLDMNLWDSVFYNEVINDEVKYRYAAWWFCCIPTSVASLSNLPLPLFVRGDDMEYSLRNKAKFITMNGISIWHQGFAGKFNPVMDYYQSKRNELIVFTSNPELAKIDSFSCIEELFWQELYKFDYIGAELLIDAVKDFLKGPEWFSSVDLFDQIQEKRKNDIKHKPITNEIRSLINYENLYVHEKTKTIEKLLYDYSYNGQSRIPRIFLKKKIGIIPYGWGYYPEKQILTEVNYAIDPVHDTYVEYKKDYKKFRYLKGRFEDVRKKYINQKEDITKKYQESVARFSSVDFWDRYLV